MVEVLGIAAFNPRHRPFGQRGFDAHHGLRLGGRGIRLIAQQLEHFLYVQHIGFTQLD